MRRTAVICCALAGVALLAGAAAGSGAASSGHPENAGVKLLSCNPLAATDGGAATFRGSMKALGGTRFMWMRFTLYQQSGLSGFLRIAAPALEGWRKSSNGVGKFAYKQAVTGLGLGAAYRVTVHYRWFGDAGRLQASASRRSHACVLPGGPNLRVTRIVEKPGPAPGTSAYRVRVSNAGETGASHVVVQLVVDGAELDAGEVQKLPGGEARIVQFTGPVCKLGVRATADPRNAIHESNETDNILARGCPAV
jgi:hypothetical protein